MSRALNRLLNPLVGHPGAPATFPKNLDVASSYIPELGSFPRGDFGVFRYVHGQGLVPEGLIAKPERQIGPELTVSVLFTDLRTTESALKLATTLAADLGAHIQVIVPYIVPFPLPLECPAVPLEFTCRRLEGLTTSANIPTLIKIYLCRDQIDLLRGILPERSIVVTGQKKRWFTKRASRIVRALRRHGHVVVSTEVDSSLD